ncbi:MAG: rRNA maturation RNase YbeY [Candidatus Omnitrophica bacterium]|nr:rRNA maturation RNase YbeY [Candidatus Omnitrophota bacterium]
MEITVHNLQKKLKADARTIQRLVRLVLTKEKFKNPGAFSITLVNGAKMCSFNKRFMGKNHSTDVLAFNLSKKTESPFLGDVIVSTDACIHNARRFATTPQFELFLYIVHGMLHLLGYRDATPARKTLMHRKALTILNAACLSIPSTP